MAKKISAPALYLQYAAARAAAFVFRFLPLGMAVGIGRLLGRLFYTFDTRHRERVKSQMQQALSIGEEEAGKLALKTYLHLGTMLVEFPRIPDMNRDNVDQLMDWGAGLEVIRGLMAEGKGLIIITGHVGNWENGGALFCLKGLCLGAIARPLDNPLIDRYVKETREHCGQEIWDKFGALRKIVRVLKNGGALAMLLDQDGGKGGEFAPFFGIEASTITTAAEIAVRTGAPLITVAVHRTDKPMRFKLTACAPHRADPTASPESERKRLLVEMNRDFEKLIRLHPEQWLWLHRRWKTRPATEKAD